MKQFMVYMTTTLGDYHGVVESESAIKAQSLACRQALKLLGVECVLTCQVVELVHRPVQLSKVSRPGRHMPDLFEIAE